MGSSGLILANRAYLDHEAPRWAESPSSSGNGGLLAALRPVIEPWDGVRGTTWIGAGLGRHDREWTDERGFELLETPRGLLRHRRLYFPRRVWQGHYAQVSNSFTWPLFHIVRYDLPAATGYYPEPALVSAQDWADFEAVNNAFAAAAAEEAAPWAWVHDYQLALVPRMLRERGFAGGIGFFLHIPFPDCEVAARYLRDGRGAAFKRLVGGMLGAGLLGFQTEGDRERFAHAASVLCGATAVEGGLEIEGRYVRTGVFPVGIDPEEVLEVARVAATPPRVQNARASGLPLVVGLERGDFTKGIPERLRAVAAAFRSGMRFAYIGIAAPTREGVSAYESLEAAVEAAADEARAAAAAVGGSFAHARANVGWNDVVALQREADVVFTSSLADGQNLVPLQAAIAQSLRRAEERGVVVTGRDAGVAHTLSGFERDGLAVVDPLDPGAMRETLVRALRGEPGRISERFVGEVRRRDALAWATGFIEALEETC